MLDKEMHIRARPDTPTLNLDALMSLFRSKDAKLWKKCSWMFDGEFRFLDGSPNKSNKIAFQSFPRSGNTFLRKYFELLTGVQTGADNTLHISIMLQMMGMKGEDLVDDTVFVIKTHSPWCMPFAPKFFSNKNVCVVRNPLPVFISWVNLVALCNHNSQSPFDYENDYPEWWDWWIRDCATNMKKWYAHTMHDSRMRKVPTLFVRFEDLITKPEPELHNLMKFMIGEADLKGTNAERRINEVLNKGHSATQTYPIKESSLKFNSAQKRFNED